MDKDEALRLGLEALIEVRDANIHGLTLTQDYHEAITAIKAALEANEFNPDWDTQAVLVEEIQRMAKRIEELEAKDEPYALEASMFSNDRVKVDPVTGNVSIGTPQQEANDEPVAWMNQNGVVRKVGYEWGPNNTLTALYATPSQRTWVGLTDDEIVLIVTECAASHQHTDIHFAKAIEAKLKEKNT